MGQKDSGLLVSLVLVALIGLGFAAYDQDWEEVVAWSMAALGWGSYWWKDRRDQRV